MSKIIKVIKKFHLDNENIKEISDLFAKELDANKNEKDLKMISSFLSYPTGCEKGKYLALDFGGTNIRVSLIELDGHNSFKLLDNIKRPLSIEGEYNYFDENSDAEGLFNFIAEIIKKIINKNEKYYLGHTFSFPFTQSNLSDAYLIEWTKEFKTKGVEGENVTRLLKAALLKKDIYNVEPVAVINDTVATFLAAAYQYKNVLIGSICGTGHNSACILEGKIVNLESGNFSKIPLNKLDEKFDSLTEKPGKQLLEKLSAGKYLGEIFRIACFELLDDNIFINKNMAKDVLAKRNIINCENISSILKSENNTDILNIMNNLNLKIKDQDAKLIFDLASSIVVRAASLVATTYLGIINKEIGKSKEDIIIAVDGSLYEKMPLYREAIDIVIAKGRKIYDIENNIKVVFENKGSELGAAIAAAIAKNNIY